MAKKTILSYESKSLLNVDYYKWLRILLIGFIGSFGVEIVTGFTSIREYNYMLFLVYFIPLAIVEDLRTRYKWSYKRIFLVGAIYGVLVDGIILKAAFSPFWNEIFGLTDFYDVRLGGFLSFVPFGHGFITFVFSFVVTDILLPRKIQTSVLKLWHYFIFVPIILSIWLYMFLVQHTLDGGYIPSSIAVLIIIAYVTTLIIISRLFKKSEGFYVFSSYFVLIILFPLLTGINPMLADVSGLVYYISLSILVLKENLKTTTKILLATFASLSGVISGIFAIHANPNYSLPDVIGTILFGLGLSIALGVRFLIVRKEF